MHPLDSRPKLVSFKATKFHGDNPAPNSRKQALTLELTQTIDVGLVAPISPESGLQALVKIDFLAVAKPPGTKDKIAEFKACYEGKYDYPDGVLEAQIAPLLDQEAYQYMLVAQSFPLAMTHFRRELQSFGVDARNLPLGI